MPLQDHPTIFGFERDFAQSLHCIPMIVRMKLDLCGIKLTLRQWNRLPLERRMGMIDAICVSAHEIALFREELLHDIARFTDEPARDLPPASGIEWNGSQDVPCAIVALAMAYGLPTITHDRWAGLTSLQRFALLKLARSHHEHRNFRPAMIEFGLISSDIQEFPLDGNG